MPVFQEFDPPSAGFSYTHQNHLRYRFLNEEGAYSPSSSYIVSAGFPERKPLSPLEESIQAAKMISSVFPPPFWIPMSGGIDSEAVALAFLHAKISFRVAILKFKDHLNWFDIKHAIKFCEKHSLPYTIFPFDIVSFYESGKHFEYAHRHRCRSPHFTVHFEMIRMIGTGTPILPWQPLSFVRPSKNDFFWSLPDDHQLAYLRFLVNENISAVPYFFLYTPELIYSFLKLPISKDLMKDPTLNIRPYTLKCRHYQDGGFSVQARKNKWTGFERVKLYYQKKYKTQEPIYDQLFRYPLEIQYPLPPPPFLRFSKKDLGFI